MMRKLLLAVLGVLALGSLIVAAPRVYTLLRYQPRITSVDDAPKQRVAIVFGAGLRRDGQVSTVLFDRVATAADLYHAGKVEKLLLSGDNRFDYYNEPGAMHRAAVGLGVPESALVADFAGRSTYDTCYRAGAIYGLNSAVLVTQAFHLPRALFTCEALGVEASGVSADRRGYRNRVQAYWNVRELFATAAAWWDLNVSRPTPVLGEPLPID
jgi:SanA protein